ncbi:hypothetical protein [Limosilactobacillus secaliphilus]|uniref:YtxH domain-containing protein n=1 Tax=Limosilactobacillus secaliphilus TaxID=396268 RepID=A0A0R2I2T7_9LACO|nr:hypothetical protein [Limosilactobacillus secaliphilus]KRN59384.1 hypothetical protein IV45_GL001127 [Limosilactobacillus secaliphilus]
MASKFLTGVLFGGLSAAAAWRMMDETQQKAVKDWIQEKQNLALDKSTEYALEFLDVFDEWLADHPEMTAKANEWSEKVKDKGDEVANHFMSDDFDEQTADLREELKSQQEDNNDDDDIIIDKTAK